jgi:hypothetical protein
MGPLLAGLALCLAFAGAASAAELRGLHLAAAPDAAQLIIDLTERVNPNIFQLSGPSRTVIDLADTHVGGGVIEPHAQGLVTAVRVGRQPGGVLRVVLQLSGPKPLHATWSAGGRQLIISLGSPAARIEVPPPVADTEPRPHPRSARTASPWSMRPARASVTSLWRWTPATAVSIPARSAMAARARRT